MAKSTIVKGKNLIFNGSKITLFGTSGANLQSGNWAVESGFGSLMIEVKPSPVSPKIQELVNEDMKAKRGDQIACIQVSPNIGVCLFLEGTVTRQHLESASEENGTIVFTDVPLNTMEGQKNFRVVVSPKTEHQMATLDAAGNIV